MVVAAGAHATEARQRGWQGQPPQGAWSRRLGQPPRCAVVQRGVLSSVADAPWRAMAVVARRYGPFWIATTLIFVTAVAGNYAQYLEWRRERNTSPSPPPPGPPGNSTAPVPTVAPAPPGSPTSDPVSGPGGREAGREAGTKGGGRTGALHCASGVAGVEPTEERTRWQASWASRLLVARQPSLANPPLPSCCVGRAGAVVQRLCQAGSLHRHLLRLRVWALSTALARHALHARRHEARQHVLHLRCAAPSIATPEEALNSLARVGGSVACVDLAQGTP